jgi:hypothetical protein
MRYTFAAVLLSLLLASPASADIALGSGLIVAPGGSIPLPVSLTNPAPPGGVTVSLFTSDTLKVTVSPDSVYIPFGAMTPPALPRLIGVAFGTASVSASAFGLAGASQTVQVSATLTGPLSQTIAQGSVLNLMLTLPSAIPAAMSLSVTSDNPSVAGVPATATIPAGGSAAVVPVSALSAGVTTVHVGSPPAISTFNVAITVYAAGSITIQPIVLTLGQSLPLVVALGAPATGAGVTLALASSDPSTVLLSTPSIFIAPGQITPTTQPEIAGGNIGVATITASAPNYNSATQQIPVTATISMSPQSFNIPVGGTRLLSMMLSAAAPSIGVPVTGDRAANGYVNGLTVQLWSSNPSVAWVQPSVNFYSDGSSVTTVVVVINGASPGTAQIHAGVPPYIPDVVANVTVGSPPAVPVSLVATAGTPQTAQVNTPFGLPLSVTALDAAALPVSGVTVTFVGPGSGPGLTFAGGVNTAVTDASGVARSSTVTANGLAGTYQVAATATGVAAPAIFTLTNATGPSGAITLPANLTVGPGQSLPFPASLTVPAPPGGVNVSFTSSSPAIATISPSSVFIQAGATAPPSQPNVTGVDFGSTTIGASTSGYASASQLLKVGATLSFSPSSLAISAPSTQNTTLNLSSTAPASGLPISLSSSNPAAASVPPSVNLLAGATSVVVPVTGVGSGAATITAVTGAPNVSNAIASVNVSSASGILLTSGVKVAPGQAVPIPVFLTSPARPGGVSVTLDSSDNSKLTINPPTAYFQEGSTSPLFQPQALGANFGTVTVTASAYGLTGTTQAVQVIGRLSAPQSQTIQQGVTSQIAFVLSWPTPAPLTLSVSSDQPPVAAVPATVVIPANGTTAYVPVTALSGGTTAIHVGALPNVAESVVNIVVQVPGTITLASGVSVLVGLSAPMPVQLAAPAPAGGVVINLVSSEPVCVSISPSSVFIPAGASASATQPVVTGNAIGTATISASAPGYITAARQVAVTATITMSPSTLIVPIGQSRLLAMVLSGAAPSIEVPITPDRAADGFVNGLTVQLSSSNPNVATVQSSVQFYPDGSSVTTVVVAINGMSPGTAQIHASAPLVIPDTVATIIVQ